MTALPPKKRSNLTIPPVVIKTILLFIALFIGGFVFLWAFAHDRVYSLVPRLVTFAGSAPVVAILSEFWRSKQKNEEFVNKRKAEVDAQIQSVREEFRRELNEVVSIIREEINKRDLQIARLKGEIKSATRFGQISDKVSAVKNENEEMRLRLEQLEKRLINNGEDPCN